MKNQKIFASEATPKITQVMILKDLSVIEKGARIARVVQSKSISPKKASNIKSSGIIAPDISKIIVTEVRTPSPNLSIFCFTKNTPCECKSSKFLLSRA